MFNCFSACQGWLTNWAKYQCSSVGRSRQYQSHNGSTRVHRLEADRGSGNSGDAPTPANATRRTDSNKGTSHLALTGSFCDLVVSHKHSLKKVKKYALTKAKPCLLVWRRHHLGSGWWWVWQWRPLCEWQTIWSIREDDEDEDALCIREGTAWGSLFTSIRFSTTSHQRRILP